MIEFEEYKQKLNNLKPELDKLGAAYDLERSKEEIEELENRASEPGFWDDMEKSQKVLQRTKVLKDKVEGFANLTTQYEDLLTLCELALEMEDDSMLEELETGFAAFSEELDSRKLAATMQFCPSMRVPAAPRRRTGAKCCTACTPAGRSATASPTPF